ncbi:hypothetical protein HTG_16845 [Natrinema mahii]|nr:hypothetical protein HTG_16845 [Natrinema mahii]
MPEIEIDEEVAMALNHALDGDEFTTENDLLREIMHQKGWIRAAKRSNPDN